MMTDPATAFFVGIAIQTFLLLAGGYGMVIKNNKDSGFLKEQIKGVQSEIKGLSEVVVKLAVQTTRLDALNERFNLLDKRLDDLRHGKGIVHGDEYHRGSN